jgi:glycosyltransferase involved in cell wall biosynthesis
MMNILFISQALPYLPSRGGFRLYGANLIRYLSRGHTVDLISFLEEGDEEQLDWARRHCSSVQVVPRNGRAMLGRLANALSAHLLGKQIHGRRRLNELVHAGLESRRWDVLHVEGGAVGGAVANDLPVAKVLSLHDSWTLRVEEMLKCSQALSEKLYYTFLKYHEPRYERLLYPRYEAVTVVAEPDWRAVSETVPEANVVLIPYGTDSDYFHPVQVQKEVGTLVFHSHLGYAPNIDAALEFAKDIFPLIRKQLPDTTFHLVGANPVPKIRELAAQPGIRISANLPDLREAVCSASVYVCPIRHGTGLKSKMLEAMAMGMPIVAYHPGSTVGIDCQHGKHLLAATTPEGFATCTLELLRDPKQSERLGRTARELVCEKYSWDWRARAYEELYGLAIERHRLRSNGKANPGHTLAKSPIS